MSEAGTVKEQDCINNSTSMSVLQRLTVAAAEPFEPHEEIREEDKNERKIKCVPHLQTVN